MGRFCVSARRRSLSFWRDVWEAVQLHFALGWLVPIAIGVCMVLMVVLLGMWRAVLGLFDRG